MQDLMEFAVDIARDAGRVILGHYRDSSLAVDHKADDSPVTVADRAAETLLRQRITAAFPDDAIVGEEHDDVPGTSGRTWYLDPIDGTKSFVHGVPLFTTLIACDDADGPLVGLIAAPALEEITVAGRGAGCFHQDAPARVSQTTDLSRAYVMTSGFEWWPDHLRERAATSPFTMRTWGDGYGYSLVATGRVEAMIDPEAAVWDLAPLPVIMTEAGGRFSSLDGGTSAHAQSALASNGHLHDALLDYFAD
ncbi:inositol monophosphatase family protein [Euzebya pacifica]|uniref:inositol monophosphatase family protein n=1 Tax=Euzebya pacifica TaxID=1608957 RepID=UPI001C1F482C|nr:inositol monophosphatase family protein [Euzebya pacifica]